MASALSRSKRGGPLAASRMVLARWPAVRLFSGGGEACGGRGEAGWRGGGRACGGARDGAAGRPPLVAAARGARRAAAAGARGGGAGGGGGLAGGARGRAGGPSTRRARRRRAARSSSAARPSRRRSWPRALRWWRQRREAGEASEQLRLLRGALAAARAERKECARTHQALLQVRVRRQAARVRSLPHRRGIISVRAVVLGPPVSEASTDSGV